MLINVTVIYAELLIAYINEYEILIVNYTSALSHFAECLFYSDFRVKSKIYKLSFLSIIYKLILFHIFSMHKIYITTCKKILINNFF